MADVESFDLKNVEDVQNRLATSLLKTATSSGLMKAKDWLQGGWSRSSKQLMDRVDIGITPEGALGGLNR